ncbi:UNKNOWN [Stylonychia lemnae]|uniref:Uncharacterized protein n=1 Tax=Stylonychia lemnae TaxID=5949 RepID=A0A078A4Y5_STYLE|nr:UNKNOWN [Stylonychia lemnae]|eukprot:CDW77325.1 UNKNOWN [Stylonychia lemnae]
MRTVAVKQMQKLITTAFEAPFQFMLLTFEYISLGVVGKVDQNSGTKYPFTVPSLLKLYPTFTIASLVNDNQLPKTPHIDAQNPARKLYLQS